MYYARLLLEKMRIVAHVHAYRHLSRVHVEAIALISISVFTPWWSVERTLPWQIIWDYRVSWADRFDILTLLNNEQEKEYEIQIDGQSVDVFIPKQIGVYYDSEALFNQFYRTTTPAQRIADSLQPIKSVPLFTNKDMLDAYIQSLQTQHQREMKNATLEFVENVPIITNEQVGTKIDAMSLEEALKSAISRGEHKISITSTPVEPVIKGDSLRQVAELYSSIKDRPEIVLSAGGTRHSLTTNDLYTLIDIPKLKEQAELTLSETLVKEYVAGVVAPKFASKGTPSQVVLTDGVPSSTTAGSAGSILEESSMVAKIIEAFSTGESEVEGALIPATIETVTEKRYSRSKTGLTLLLEDWDNEKSGEWGVSVVDNSDSSIQASLHPEKLFVTASIYKMFVAAYVYNKIDSGEISGSSATALSKTFDQCLTDMIVVSDNACPTYFFNHFGYSAIQSYVVENGYSATDLDNSRGGDKYTSAQDVMALLLDLKNGALISSSSLQQLRSNMSRQIYRSGIPKGATGTSVEDKVGFLYGYTHDVGYVQGSRPYTIVILSNGASFSAIAELSQRIHATMTR